MTREETAQILRVIKTEWRHSFANITRQDMENMLNLWAEMFADDDAGIVGAAVKSIIVAGNREFAPNIGQIKEQMRKLTEKHGDKSEAEAWARIRKAIRNSGYESREEFERLPPILQRLVGSPSQLREWAMMDSDELNTVVASNVQRAYRTMQQREIETAKLPKEVKAYIAGYAQKLALSDGKEDEDG